MCRCKAGAGTHSFLTKQPLMLDKSHWVDLIIEQIHAVNRHCGIGLTMIIVRKKYYIPTLQQRAIKCIRRCVLCIKMRGKSAMQKMAYLPSERIRLAALFENVGTNLCGPFQVKASNLRKSKFMKMYIVVLVFLATKAIHFELCMVLSTTTFLAAFQKFISRRGQRTVRSDNGTNLVGASKVLKQAWHQLAPETEGNMVPK